MLVQTSPRKLANSLLAGCIILLMIAVGFTSAQTVEETKEAPNPVVASPADAEHRPVPEPIEAVPAPRQVNGFAPSRIFMLAQPELPTRLSEPVARIAIGENEIRTLEFAEPIPQVMVAEPAIVSVTPKSPYKIVVCGKSQGTTDMTISFASGEEKTFNIGVGIQEPELVVLNLKMITMDKAKWSELAIDFAKFDGAAKKSGSMGAILAAESVHPQQNGSLQIKEVSEDAKILDWLHSIEDGLPGVGTVMAPTMTTIMSHEAAFRVGGEVPFEKETVDGKVVEFKPFGTMIRITPKPTDDPNHVELQIRSELSKLKGSNIVLLRKFSAGVRMKYGNTLVTARSYTEDGVEKEVLLLVTPSLIDQP